MILAYTQPNYFKINSLSARYAKRKT